MTKPKDPNECGVRINLYFATEDELIIAKRKAAAFGRRIGMTNPGRALSAYLRHLIRVDDPFTPRIAEVYKPARD